MLRCVTGQAFPSLPATTLTAICHHTRHVIVQAHEAYQPQQQPLQPQQQQTSSAEEVLDILKDTERDFTAHRKDVCQWLDNIIEQQSAASQKLDDMLEDMSEILEMTKDMNEQLSAMSETSRLISGTHPRKTRLQLEVGERAGSHATFHTVPDWLQRLAVPLQAAGIPPAAAQANIFENMLKV
jgi:hypothetical protein